MRKECTVAEWRHPALTHSSTYKAIATDTELHPEVVAMGEHWLSGGER